MSATGTPKASKAAVAAVQDALHQHFGYDIEADEREALARALTDAAAPHIAAQTLRDAADEAEEFATETYALDIFRKPTTADYKAINGLLLRERGHELDGVAADCYRRAIGLTAKRLRETASDIEAGQ